MEERVAHALGALFSLSPKPPLPSSLGDSIDLAADCPPGDILSFRDAQLGRMAKLTKGSLAIDAEWNELIPLQTRPSAGNLRLSPLMSLMYRRIMGGGGLALDAAISIRLSVSGGAQPVTHHPSV